MKRSLPILPTSFFPGMTQVPGRFADILKGGDENIFHRTEIKCSFPVAHSLQSVLCLKISVVNMCSRAKYQVTRLSLWQILVMISCQSNIEFYDKWLNYWYFILLMKERVKCFSANLQDSSVNEVIDKRDVCSSVSALPYI